jgi:hypothetical protein
MRADIQADAEATVQDLKYKYNGPVGCMTKLLAAPSSSTVLHVGTAHQQGDSVSRA